MSKTYLSILLTVSVLFIATGFGLYATEYDQFCELMIGLGFWGTVYPCWRWSETDS